MVWNNLRRLGNTKYATKVLWVLIIANLFGNSMAITTFKEYASSKLPKLSTAVTNSKAKQSTQLTTNAFKLQSTTETSELSSSSSSSSSFASLVSPSPSPSSSVSSSPSPSPSPLIPDICIDGITSGQSGQSENFLQIIEGDATISILTTDPTTALFVVNQINQAGLIGGDFELGVRVIHINSLESKLIGDILMQEVQYLQLCVVHSIGIFLDYDLYNAVQSVIDILEYYIWRIPSTRQFIYPRVAHLLYQLPWGEKSASVEIHSENSDVYNDFMDATKAEHLCLMHFQSPDTVYVLLGNKIIENFKENGTIFAVLNDKTNKSFIKELPYNSFILMESEIGLKTIDISIIKEKSTSDVLLGESILSSRLFVLSGPLIDMTRRINDSLTINCKISHGVYQLESCSEYLGFIEDWNVKKHQYTPIDILNILKIRKLSHLMRYEMYQKLIDNSETDFDSMPKMRQIATQEFVSNVTTQFHYEKGNTTSKELKSKFGQIFNCQYGGGLNRNYPFYFEGESVMYWHIKPDSWIAAGLTASGLGVLISLAILAFILIRVAMGDVFEGNPVSSILLLMSLVILFLTFIPFAMEYTSDHRNSRVTYVDAEILNTMCAVRVFLITLSYCMTLSLLLSRGLMIASIGSEGGFLSHVNGYIQSVICIFSTLVQLGLSTQLLVVMHLANEEISCDNIYYGNWFWAVLGYDFILLIFLVLLTPLIYRSQRNYREGILLVIVSILILIVFCTWITLCFFGREWRDAVIPLGIQATGWSVLVGILVPRTFLIVRGIERSDIAQALPSLASLAFAQNNQYSSEQSVYECVNPAMRHSGSREDNIYDHHMGQSPSEIPTLPLRGAGPRRQQQQHRQQTQQSQYLNTRTVGHTRQASTHSSMSSLPPSPPGNKITRF